MFKGWVISIAIAICYSFGANAQSLRGKLIYVSSSQPVKLKFGSRITNYSFIDRAQAGLFNIDAGKKNLSVTSNARNFRTANLVITEGSNSHLFILEYKELLDAAVENSYDFSSAEKLNAEVQKLKMVLNNSSAREAFGKSTTYIPEFSSTNPTTTAPAVNGAGTNHTDESASVKLTTEASNASKLETPASKKEQQNINKPSADNISKTEAKKPETKKLEPNNVKPDNAKTLQAKADVKTTETSPAETNPSETNPSETKNASTKNPSTKDPAANALTKNPNNKKLTAATNTPPQTTTTAPVQTTATTPVAKSTPAQQNEPKTLITSALSQPNTTPEEEEHIPDAYELLVHLGDSTAWIAKNFKGSLYWYDSARKVNPQATYTYKQIAAVKQVLNEQALAAKKQRSEKFQAALPDYKAADVLRVERKFDEAYKAYNKFLSQLDSTSFHEYMPSELYYINQAKDYIVRLQPHLSRPKPVVAPPPAEDNIKKKKKKRKGSL
jgi:hypothetical protein